jgi:hypothetical protein
MAEKKDVIKITGVDWQHTDIEEFIAIKEKEQEKNTNIQFAGMENKGLITRICKSVDQRGSPRDWLTCHIGKHGIYFQIKGKHSNHSRMWPFYFHWINPCDFCLCFKNDCHGKYQNEIVKGECPHMWCVLHDEGCGLYNSNENCYGVLKCPLVKQFYRLHRTAKIVEDL